MAEGPEWLTTLVAEYNDYPEPGVLFRDLGPVWASSAATARVAMALAAGAGDATAVAGIEARGFIAGMAVAQRLGVGFVALRKPGKLPGETLRRSYSLEYGHDELELQVGALDSTDRVLIVDDVIATGGTAAAAAELVTEAGADVHSIRAVIELVALGGRDRIGNRQVEAIWSID